MKSARIFAISVAATSLGACALLSGEEPFITSQKSSGQQQQAAAANTPAVSEQLVRNVQQQLDARGIDAGPVDGIWGPRTQQGVQQFQQAQGLESTGELNTSTLAALGIVEQQTAADSQGEQSASAGATAQTDQAKPEFRNLDANEDQYVTLAEAAADTRISRDFKRADENNDMKLSREEFRRAVELQRPR